MPLADKRFAALVLCILFLIPSIVKANEQPVSRGLFIWSLEDKPVLSSRAQMDEAVSFAKKSGITTIFIQVYRANQAWFASKVADSSRYEEASKALSGDPLGLFIKKAHAQGIKVHAWVNLLSLGANKNALILKKYGPSILTRNVSPKKTLDDYKIDNQFFLEPSDTRVRHQLAIVVGDLLRAYPDLDGIQFDYIRYPDVHPFYGYSKANVEHYLKATGLKKVVEEDPKWKQWKRDQVTELLSMLVTKVRSIRPEINVSTTGCLSYSRALDEALQDWPSWLNTYLVDFVTVMNYPPDLATYQKNIEEIKLKVKNIDRVNMAVGTYKFVHTPQVFHQQFRYCEQAGLRACVIFHYNNFLENPELGSIIQN